MTNNTALQTRKYFDYNAVPERETRAFLRKKAELGKSILKRTAQGIWEMGELLSGVREVLRKDGDFTNWVEVELGLTWQTATNFVRVFERFPEMTNQNNFDCAPTILYTLSAPSVSEETREAAVEEIKAGNIRTVAQAKAFVAPKPAPKAESEAQVLEGEVLGQTDEGREEFELGRGDEPTAPSLAERAANAEVLHDSLSEVRQERAAQAQESAQNDADVSFEEWKRGLPIWRVLSPLGGRAIILERALRDWRVIEKALSTFKHHVARCECVKSIDDSPFARVLSPVHALPHPQYWKVCPPCKGGGCAKCGESGYDLKTGIEPARIEAGGVNLT